MDISWITNVKFNHTNVSVVLNVQINERVNMNKELSGCMRERKRKRECVTTLWKNSKKTIQFKLLNTDRNTYM